MMRSPIALMGLMVGAALLVCCNGAADHGDDRAAAAKPWSPPADSIPRARFPMIDDNVHHDTLLVQVTFDLLDSTYVMVASNVEETFEGLCLVRYGFAKDGTVRRLCASAPAYDSWTMLPTFFPMDTAADDTVLWVLANFGEKESWGQKAMLLDREFVDVGFMDVTLPERVIEDDTLRLKHRNIGPRTRHYRHGDTTFFRFACDSVFLYDDQAGNMDQVLPASDVFYSYLRAEGLALWIAGRKRLVRKPA